MPCTISSAPVSSASARARSDVVGVEVRDHDAAHLRVAEQRERLRQRLPVSGVPRPQSIERPALGILDRVAVHVVERPGKRQRDAVHAAAEIRPRARAAGARQGAVRPNSTNAACVTGMCSAKMLLDGLGEAPDLELRGLGVAQR